MSEPDPIAVRVEALESLLLERGLIDPAAVDAVIEHYEKDVGPLNGAKVIARAWTDDTFRRRLLDHGTKAIAELGFGGVEGADMRIVENTNDVHNVVVCTLCSCYPWPVLGLPPSWYKSPQYRSRMVVEPRKVLAEMGLAVSDDVRIRVWDSSAEARYLVLPQRPSDTEGWTAEQLVPLVTRDSMIGVALASEAADAGR
ncbi:nitrile hydratase subunit alpha [Mycolicibacterium arseniciresistens]|uniref:nitrile hydratase n=1 Tax=Mycolicibacterium arseniciresistens TaxID=3062257 RepID=A0ABT8UKK3_9MYCO|nr:nitrile hydratase subunit alpha [Mycolicibacterium arseniciresistens]MDO3638330.1 nitrile hydratase subunit alpha [Mycolicibacterium arseniciresistens]